jgi:hypothetical protein
MTTPEYMAQYATVGPTTSNAANLNFVQLVYAHVLGRAGDPLGIAYWTNCLDLQYGVSGAPVYSGPGTPQPQTREQVIAYLSTSPENIKELTTLGFINTTNNTFTLEPSA